MVHRFFRFAIAHVRRTRVDDRGIVAVMSLLFMTAALGLAAIVVDLGNARQEDRKAEASADAAALAAAQKMEDFGSGFTGSPSQWTAIANEAKLYTEKNYGISTASWVGCTDEDALSYHPDVGNSDQCISADYVSWPTPGATETSLTNRIRVKLPEHAIPTGFGSLLGKDELYINAHATSGVARARQVISVSVSETVLGGPCAICVLGPGLSLDEQNGDVTVTGGNVVVNSTASTAADLHANGHLRVLNGGKIGGPGAPGNFSGSGYTPNPTHLDPVADPLAAIPQCGTGSTCPTNTASAGSNGSTLNPGIYSSIGGSHTLNPGIYVLKGDITLNGNDKLTGDGVMLYFACSSYPTPCNTGQSGAGIKATGNGAMRIFPPTVAQCTTQPSVCPYVGMMIFADRKNTATSTYRGNGTNENGILTGGAGTIYLKAGTLDPRGNGYTLFSMVVVNVLNMNGNPSGVTVAYDLTRNYAVTHEESHTESTTTYSYDAVGLVS